jgi:hypothetical protein
MSASCSIAPGFTQVRHHRPLVLALLHAAIQLRQRDDRAMILFASAFKPREISEISVARFSFVPAPT